MLETFKGIEPRAIVRYRTPQGDVRRARACPLLLFPSHVVCDMGDGRPVVVDSYNYVSHRNPRSK